MVFWPIWLFDFFFTYPGLRTSLPWIPAVPGLETALLNCRAGRGEYKLAATLFKFWDALPSELLPFVRTFAPVLRDRQNFFM